METPGTAFAATWRDDQGEIVGTTFGGTMCWFPKKGYRLRIKGEGFEHIVRCGECPGCLEFDRRRLMERLHSKYSRGSAEAAAVLTSTGTGAAASAAEGKRQLFLVRIYAPLARHAAISHALHRRRGLELERGFARLGTSSFAILTRVASPLRRVLRSLGLEHRIEPVRLSRGRRAWRSLTAGILVSRDAYGENVNRFYFGGLPPADRQKWTVEKVAKYEPYSRTNSPRAWRVGNLSLVPPGMWGLRRSDRRAVRSQFMHAGSPEQIAEILRVLANGLGNRNRLKPLSAAPQARPNREAQMLMLKSMAARESASTASPDPDPDLNHPAWGVGYVSSEHSESHDQARAGPPDADLAREAALPAHLRAVVEPDPDWARRDKEQREERKRRSMAQLVERLRKKAKGEG